MSHPVTVGSALIYNPSNWSVTVQLGPGAAGSTPGYGQGFQLIAGGGRLPIAVGQKSVSRQRAVFASVQSEPVGLKVMQ